VAETSNQQHDLETPINLDLHSICVRCVRISEPEVRERAGVFSGIELDHSMRVPDACQHKSLRSRIRIEPLFRVHSHIPFQ
jgi:hypothetical protein